MDYLDQIATAILELHHCASVHECTVPVREMFQNKVVWEGEVEVFGLIGHPKARTAYAWGVQEPDGRWEITTVLEILPVNSPEMAVKAAIAATAKKSQIKRIL